MLKCLQVFFKPNGYLVSIVQFNIPYIVMENFITDLKTLSRKQVNVHFSLKEISYKLVSNKTNRRNCVVKVYRLQ